MVYVVLGGWVGECETQVHLADIITLVVGIDEVLEAVGDILPKLIGASSLEFLGHLVLGLDDVKLGLLLGESDLADTEVSSAHIKSEEGSLLIAGGVSHAPCWVHGLECISYCYR